MISSLLALNSVISPAEPAPPHHDATAHCGTAALLTLKLLLHRSDRNFHPRGLFVPSSDSSLSQLSQTTTVWLERLPRP